MNVEWIMLAVSHHSEPSRQPCFFLTDIRVMGYLYVCWLRKSSLVFLDRYQGHVIVVHFFLLRKNSIVFGENRFQTILVFLFCFRFVFFLSYFLRSLCFVSFELFCSLFNGVNSLADIYHYKNVSISVSFFLIYLLSSLASHNGLIWIIK